jgi:hypothetical protein
MESRSVVKDDGKDDKESGNDVAVLTVERGTDSGMESRSEGAGSRNVAGVCPCGLPSPI